MKNQKVMVYEGQKDLLFDKNQKTLRRELSHDRGQFVFDPEDFKGQSKNFKIESFRLPEDGLHEYARLASRLRT